MPEYPQMRPEDLMRVLGLGGDPAAGRPGVNVSPPGQRALPGAGPITTGRAYNPQVGPEQTVPVPLPPRAPASIRPGRGDLMQNLLSQTGVAPQPIAEEQVAAGQPVTDQVVGQLGGVKPFLRSMAAGMQAPSSTSGIGSLMSGFAGATQYGAESEAAAAKVAREEAKEARRLAMEERKLTSEERRAEASDRRAAAEAARSERRLGMEEETFAETKRRRESGETAYDEAETDAAREIKLKIGEPDKWTGTPEEYDQKFQDIMDKHLARKGLPTGSGRIEAPFQAGKFAERNKEGAARLLQQEGNYARLKREDGKTYLHKSTKDPSTGQMTWQIVDEKAEQDAATAAKTPPGFKWPWQ